MTSQARTDVDPTEETGPIEEELTAVVLKKEPDILTIATKVDAHEEKLNIHESRWNQLGGAAPIKTEAKLERPFSTDVNLWEIM